jgi:hypothetical protein
MLFNITLCFLNTKHMMAAGSTQVIAIEMAIPVGLLAARNLVGRAVRLPQWL